MLKNISFLPGLHLSYAYFRLTLSEIYIPTTLYLQGPVSSEAMLEKHLGDLDEFLKLETIAQSELLGLREAAKRLHGDSLPHKISSALNKNTQRWNQLCQQAKSTTVDLQQRYEGYNLVITPVRKLHGSRLLLIPVLNIPLFTVLPIKITLFRLSSYHLSGTLL